jgi:hypothetical protein
MVINFEWNDENVRGNYPYDNGLLSTLNKNTISRYSEKVMFGFILAHRRPAQRVLSSLSFGDRHR